MSALATAVRQLLGNPTSPAHGTWPLEHSIFASLAWTALLLVIFVPLCAARYARWHSAIADLCRRSRDVRP